MHSKKFEEVFAIMEEQEKYTEAVLFVAHRLQKSRALQLASNYIGQKYVLRSDIDQSMIRYGKQQVKVLSAKGPKERDRLLTIINVIPPELQVQYLEQVEAYDKATEVLIELGKVDCAYELMLKHAMYKEAFDLSKQQNNLKKKQRVILSTAKFKLSSCHTTQTEIPVLQEELETMCHNEKVTPTVRAIANLLQSKLSGDSSYCHNALQLFQQEKHTLGACEALVILLPNIKKDMQLVETVLNVCIEVNKICFSLKKTRRDTAFISHIMDQVEELYGFVKERDQYVLQVHQDIWSIMGQWPEGNRMQRHQRASEVCRAVSVHLQLNIRLLIGNKECWDAVQNEMVAFEFHHKCTEQPFANEQLKLLNYIKAYSMSLEIICHNEKFDGIVEWKRHFYNIIRYNGLTLNSKHFDVIKHFPNVVSILECRLVNMLQKPVNVLTLDDWMEMWILSQSLKQTDFEVSQRTRPIPSDSLRASDRHFYVLSSQIDGIEHKVPHFCQWIKFCHLLREGSQARIAVKVLMNYMDKIARRVSLNRDIVCVTNIVTMLSISAMIYYAFKILTSPQQATLILPQILIDTMTRFDQKNCLTKQDYELFQACFDTFQIFAKNPNPTQVIKLRAEAQTGIEHVLQVLTGLSNKGFDVLHRAVTNESHNNIVTCLTLALTLLGNLALSIRYRPSDLLQYQQGIQSAVQPLMKQTDHHLRGVCEDFQCCTSARDIFSIVARLNENYYRGEKTNYLFSLHPLKSQMNLMPCPLTRVPTRSVLHLVIHKAGTPLAVEEDTVNPVEKDSTSMAKDNGDEVEAQTDLERQESNEDEFDEDVRRALTFKESEQVPTVEQKVSIDDTLVDDVYCKVCKAKLERVGSKSARLEHIESMGHKSKMGDYTSFTNVQQNISKAMQRWESDIKYFQLLPQEVSEAENVLIIKVQDHIRHIESLSHNIEKDGNWREGEQKLQSLQSINNSISNQLQEVIEAVESSQQTEKADAAEHDGEDKTEIWPTESAGNDDSGEEVLSGVEDEVSPTQAKRKIKKKL